MHELRVAFAGDRDIGVWVLDFILAHGVKPLALLVPDESRATQAETLRRRCAYLPKENISVGRAFQSPAFIERLRRLELDYIFGIHFPYIVPKAVLAVAGKGFLNLHPAYLPFNRGWHGPSWSILEGTPSGATLHFMDEGLDTGDIIHRKPLETLACDTADTLYQKLKRAELECFEEAWPRLLSGKFERTLQDPLGGTFHKRRELCQEEVQRIELDQPIAAGELLAKLRALTTNRLNEAAYFEVDGVKHRVQVTITPDAPAEPCQLQPPEPISATILEPVKAGGDSSVVFLRRRSER
jgi:methionyl-tRNA formyltransferase